MKDRWFVAAVVLALVLAVATTGCNREKVPKLGSVKGTITLDGQPVNEALVTFDGVGPEEPPSMGQTDAQGKYELFYSRGNKGATVGEHVVRITTYGETGDDDSRQVRKETIPSRYNAKSELKADVKRGSNTHDFELKSGGEILQPGEPAGKAGKKKGGKGTGCG